MDFADTSKSKAKKKRENLLFVKLILWDVCTVLDVAEKIEFLMGVEKKSKKIDFEEVSYDRRKWMRKDFSKKE